MISRIAFFLLLFAFLPLFTKEATLYYSPSCPYCQQVLHYLESVNRQISLENVKESTQAKETLKKLGGKLEVPCLIVDDKAIYQSGPILKWIEENQELLPSRNLSTR